MNGQKPNENLPGSGMPGETSYGGPGGQIPGSGMPGQSPPGGLGGMPGGGPPGAPMQDKASGMAIASLILSMAGLLCGITAIVGIILGAIELGKIKRGESSPKGKGLAKAGIIVGAAVLALSILITIISIVTGNFSAEIST